MPGELRLLRSSIEERDNDWPQRDAIVECHSAIPITSPRPHDRPGLWYSIGTPDFCCWPEPLHLQRTNSTHPIPRLRLCPLAPMRRATTTLRRLYHDLSHRTNLASRHPPSSSETLADVGTPLDHAALICSPSGTPS
ncbi:hypothetical protein SMMN14_01001 [Sphaerulina musiva]